MNEINEKVERLEAFARAGGSISNEPEGLIPGTSVRLSCRLWRT